MIIDRRFRSIASTVARCSFSRVGGNAVDFFTSCVGASFISRLNYIHNLTTPPARPPAQGRGSRRPRGRRRSCSFVDAHAGVAHRIEDRPHEVLLHRCSEPFMEVVDVAPAEIARLRRSITATKPQADDGGFTTGRQLADHLSFPPVRTRRNRPPARPPACGARAAAGTPAVRTVHRHQGPGHPYLDRAASFSLSLLHSGPD